MVSSKDANAGEGTGNMWDHCPYQWFHRMGQGALSIFSSEDAKEVGDREHHTLSGICVAFYLQFAA